MRCYNCGEVAVGKVGRQQSCENCQRDLRVCRNCEFYDLQVSQECREPQADYVRDKETANFCDFFQPRSEAIVVGGSRAVDPVAEARRAFDSLFKK
jgi:hypothetical protein